MYDPPIETMRLVSQYLSTPLPSTYKELQDHLIALESTRLELSKTVVDWHQKLQEKENQMLHPKDKELTELDRKIMLNASIANIQRDYDFLTKLEVLTTDRLSFGQLLLTKL